MAEQKGSEQPKSLEMRVAELEDKLSKMHVTEDEIKAYHKVAALAGGQAAGALSPQVCTIARCVVNPICIVRPICIIRCIINVCECYECGGCGPCAPTSGTSGGGGFGSLGT